MKSDSKRLINNITQEYILNLIEKAQKRYKVPAIAISIMNSDNIVFNIVKGYRENGTSKFVETNDYFHIGSCSKSVLATIAGILIKENKITWKTKFFDIFPEMKTSSNPEYFDITLEDLFLCEAGIKPYTSSTEEFPPAITGGNDERYAFIQYSLKLPASSKKNSSGKFVHLYSNAGYTIASAMLERVAKMSYEQLIDFYIKRKMGLDVAIGWPNRISENQPWGHIITGNKLEIFSPTNKFEIPFVLFPAGNLSFPLTEFSKFVQFHLQGLTGNDNFIDSDTYKYIHFYQKGFSLGVVNGTLAGYSFSGMDGSAGTFFCRAIIVPSSDFAFVIMMNAGSGEGQMQSIDWITMEIVKKYYGWWWKFWL